MRWTKVIVLVMSGAVVAMGGCSSDDDDDAAGGKAGKTSSGGRGGRAADKGGTVGKGGTSGRGGASGKGGSAGGGGACIEKVATQPLGDSCGSAEYATVSTECSFAETCKDLDCGAPFSDFDANGCRRWPCNSSDTCDNGERCVPDVLHGGGSCRPGVYEWCEVSSDCKTCECSVSADCNSLAFCLPELDFPTSSDCSLAGRDCDALTAFFDELADDYNAHFEGDAKEAIAACRKKVSRAIDTCHGVGGAGAGGQSGGGGQAGN